METARQVATIVDKADFRSAEAAEICKIGLYNYFAGALLLPYQAFLDAARLLRHDLDLLVWLAQGRPDGRSGRRALRCAHAARARRSAPHHHHRDGDGEDGGHEGRRHGFGVGSSDVHVKLPTG